MNVETMAPLIERVSEARDREDAASANLDTARREHLDAMEARREAEGALHDAMEQWIGKRPEPEPCDVAA